MSIVRLPPVSTFPNDPVTSHPEAKMDDRFFLLSNLISTFTREANGQINYRVMYVPVRGRHTRTKLLLQDRLVTWEICYNCIYLHLHTLCKITPAVTYQFHIAAMDDKNVHFDTDGFSTSISIAILWNQLNTNAAIRSRL